MDKFLIRKDVYEDMIEKGYGKRDLSKLTKKKVTDKNGHTRTVYVRNGEQPAETKQPKAQEGLSDEKRAKYEEMLEKVKAGPDENALFVKGKGMLNKKDAIAHLEVKLGKKLVSSAAQGHLESDTPQNTDITKEDETRFGKQALSDLSGKRTGKTLKDELQELKDKGEEVIEDERMKVPIDHIIELIDEVEKDGWTMTPFVGQSTYMKNHGYDVKNAGGVFVIKKPKLEEEYKENYLDKKNKE